jgi:hypothetical protein
MSTREEHIFRDVCYAFSLIYAKVNMEIRIRTQPQDREAELAPLLLPEKPDWLSGPYIEVPPGLLLAFSTVEPPPTAGPVPVGPVL